MSSIQIFTLLLVVCLLSYVYGKPSEIDNQALEPLRRDEFTQTFKQSPEIEVITDLIKAVAICQIIWAEENGQQQQISQEARNLLEALKDARTCEFIKQEGPLVEGTKYERRCKALCKIF